MMLEKADADGELSLQLMQEGAVIKIRSLAGVCSDGKTERIAFSHNAELEIIDDYYFLGTPVLKFRNAGYEQIRIDYRIYYKGDGVTSQFIQYIRQNKDLRDELNGEIYRKGQLQAEIEAEKAALAHREEELQETRKQKQFLEEELERMRQRKVVRMADKVQHVIKGVNNYGCIHCHSYQNGGHLFEKVLDAVFKQKTEYEYEVICVDSGSKDGTLDVIRKYPCRLFQIEPSEFGHGKTRNYGASKGNGTYIIFITQDALPATDTWLQNFIDAMKMDPEIVGGFGIHYPYPDCNLLDKRDLDGHFKGFGETNTIFHLDDPERYEREEGYRHYLAFFSDNNSCIRRDIFEKYPYEDVNFAEDQIWARKMIELGFKKYTARMRQYIIPTISNSERISNGIMMSRRDYMKFISI